MLFKKITVNCSSDLSDTVSYTLNEAGSLGEVFDDYADVLDVLNEKRWDYADAALFNKTEGCSVSGFFTSETDENTVFSRLEQLKSLDYADFSSLSYSCEIIDSKEWENEWKKYYVPFNIGKIVIVPEWMDYTNKPGDNPVKLNPGLAFGTGMHETTSMCIELLQKTSVRAKRVLDFGCGSGILGICANALGARDVVFADNDEQAIAATRYNCKINGITSPNVYEKDVRNINEPADIVLANITADVLISVEHIIKNSLKKGGYAVISGIIADRSSSVQAEYEKHFTLIETAQKNEWRAFLFKL